MLNLLLQLETINDEYIHFYEQLPIVSSPVIYRRLHYTHPEFTLNTLIIPLKFENIVAETYYDKLKYKFSITSNNRALISKLTALESSILKKVTIPGKKIQLNLTEQLKLGHLKVNTNTPHKPSLSILLKIIGIWENTNDYGLNFKVYCALV